MRAILAAAAVAFLLGPIGLTDAGAHDAHFSAGVPGDPKKPARTVKVIMHEDGKKMLFEPAQIAVRKGEQIRFVSAKRRNGKPRIRAGDR